MIVSQIKEIIAKKYEEAQNLVEAYCEMVGYVQGLKDFGVINRKDYWELKEYNQLTYKTKLEAKLKEKEDN